MPHRGATLASIAAVVLLCAVSFGQKIEFDRTVDFRKFQTYSWAQLDPVRLPLVRLAIIGAVDAELQAKGLTKIQGPADLLVSYSGDMVGEASHGVAAPAYPGYAGAPPSINSTMWSGGGAGTAGASATYPKGTLVVELVDASKGLISWRGTAKVKLDIEQKSKSLQRIDEQITKMFKRYPPQQGK